MILNRLCRSFNSIKVQLSHMRCIGYHHVVDSFNSIKVQLSPTLDIDYGTPDLLSIP